MSRRILLADDSVTIQKVIELTFMEEDYEVVAAGDGDEALERLDELRPDFVIADVHMPGASGIDVCRRSKELYPDVPVLLLVGTFEPFDEDEARTAGADAHLKKPFDSQELLQLVEDLMGPEESAPPAAGAGIAAAADSGDSTWGFDVAEAEEEERPPQPEPEWAVPAGGEPEWAVPAEDDAAGGEPEWAAPAAEPEWAAPAAEEPDSETPAAEPEWAMPAAGRPEWAAPAGEPAGEVEWGPLDPQPAEVSPPAVGQVEVSEPTWDRPFSGRQTEESREPFHLGAVEPRHRGHEEVFELDVDEPAEDDLEEPAAEPAAAEPAAAEPAGSYGGAAGWGFAVEEAGSPGQPGESDREISAAGFRWDEPDEPSSLVTPPPDEPAETEEEPAFEAAAETAAAPSPWERPESVEAQPAGEAAGWEAEPEAEQPVPLAAEPDEGEPAPFAAAGWQADSDATGAEPPAADESVEPQEAAEPEAPAEPQDAAEPEEAAVEPSAARLEPAPATEAVPGSGASYGGASVAAPPAAAAASSSSALSDDDVERIARRVAQLIGERVTREVAWEVVPDLAEVVIRERLRELEGQID